MGRRASRRFGALSLNLGGGRGLNSGPRLLSSIRSQLRPPPQPKARRLRCGL